MAKRQRAAAEEVTSEDVADCIQRKWAAARARDAERDATTGRGVDGRAHKTTGCGDAGGAGTKRPRPTDGRGDGRAAGATRGSRVGSRGAKKEPGWKKKRRAAEREAMNMSDGENRGDRPS